MSVISHHSSDARYLAFGRRDDHRHYWRRAVALVKRAYGPLIIYAVIGIALIAALAIRVAMWVPQVWH
jgi:hypothetical protein